MPEQLKLPEKVNTLICMLSAHGYEAYAVGGCVRDVTELGGRLPDAVPGGFADPDGGVVVQDVRHGGPGHSGEARDIGAGRYGDFGGLLG